MKIRITWTGPAWSIWVDQLPTTYTQLNNSQAVLTFTCGIGVLFFQPLAIIYGRRSSYIIASILMMAGLAFGETMTGIGYYFAYTVLGGFGSAPSYSLNETSILDVSFLHQRGTLIGIYGLVLQFGNFLPAIPAGFIIDAQGWRWCFRYLLIFMGVTTLLIIFATEETSYPRNKAINETTGIEETSYNPEKVEVTETSTEDESSRIDQSIPKDGYWKRMSFIRKDPTYTQGYWKTVFFSFQYVGLPAVAWASLVISFKSFMVSFIFGTQSSFFSIPPYNFSAGAQGLMFIALLIGNSLGTLAGGYGADLLVLFMARRNNGISEPEHRLWAYAPVPFLAAGGFFMYGLGAAYGLHWIVPCIGLGLIGFAFNIMIPVAATYAFDCYPESFAESVQMMNFLRNTVGGILSFAIRPWINQSGVKNSCIAIGMLFFIIHGTFLPMAIWGKKLRKKSQRYYVKIQSKRDGY